MTDGDQKLSRHDQINNKWTQNHIKVLMPEDRMLSGKAKLTCRQTQTGRHVTSRVTTRANYIYMYELIKTTPSKKSIFERLKFY